MRAKIDKFTDDACEAGIKCPQSVREKWIKYWEDGFRLCRVSSEADHGTRLMVLSDKPITSERIMVLKLLPATFVEVWSDIDHKLGSAWVRSGGKTYYGGKVSGWKFREAIATPDCEFKQASSAAMKSLLLFRQP